MKQINIYEIVAEVYEEIVDDFVKIIQIFNSDNLEKELDKWVEYKLPSRYTLGGSRKSAKSFTIFIISLIAASLIPKSLVLIDRKNSNERVDTWKQVIFILNELLGMWGVVKKINKGEMEMTFHNDSSIVIRSVYDPAGNIKMKGVPRKNYTLAMLINEESNVYDKEWFNLSSEAITAEKKIQFRLFNTDSLKQYIVNDLQKQMPESEFEMIEKGYQKKLVKREIDVDGKSEIIYERLFRTNYRIAKKFLTKEEIIKINRDYEDDPIRGRVARDGLNGRDGKRLYYNLKPKHFIQSEKLRLFNNFHKLPYQLFTNYRVGVDEGHSQDKAALTLWGITNELKAIRLEKCVISPNGVDLDINDLARTFANKLREWANIYLNMSSRQVNIRVEWAGNGVAIKQEMSRVLERSRLNYTIDKAKKSIDTKTKKQVGSNKESQPELEARASIKNLLLGRNQLLFWNSDKETYDEYMDRSRDKMGKIVDGDDHEGDADDYALIPIYKEMIEKTSFKTLRQELLEIMHHFKIKGVNELGKVIYLK